MKGIERVEPALAALRVNQLANALLLLPLVDNEAVVREAIASLASDAAKCVKHMELAPTYDRSERARRAVYAYAAAALDHARGIAASLRLYHRTSSDSMLLLTLAERVEQAIAEFWDDAFIADVIVGDDLPPCTCSPTGRLVPGCIRNPMCRRCNRWRPPHAS